MKNIFREIPPPQICEDLLKSIGLKGLHDFNQFNKFNFSYEKVRNILERLRPFYFPIYASTYLDREDFGFNDFLNILRQLLRTMDISLLHNRKRCYEKGKVSYYREYRLKKVLEPKEEFVVSFD